MTSTIRSAWLLASATMAVLTMSHPAHGQMSSAQQQAFEQQRRQYLESLIPRTQAEKDAAWAEYDALESSAARAAANRRPQPNRPAAEQARQQYVDAMMEQVEQTHQANEAIKQQRAKIGKKQPHGKPNISPTDAPLKLAPNQAKGYQRMHALLIDRVRIELEREEDDTSYLTIVRALEEAWALGSRDPEIPLILGFALLKIGDIEESVRWLSAYLKSNNNRSSQAYKNAQRYLKEAQKQHPGWRDFNQRFTWSDKTRGEVKDRKTGLIWEFCNSHDGPWDGRWCTNLEEEKTWDETMVYAMEKARSTGQPWRVPSREELKEAMRYFPEALAGGYMWTTSLSDDGRAYVLSGYMAQAQRAQRGGEVVPEAQLGPPAPKHQHFYYRLVR